MVFTVEYEQEDDGRWLAEIRELPGVLAYGQTSEEAVAKAQALALRVLADRLEHGESAHGFVNIFCRSMSQWSSAKARLSWRR